MPNYIVMSKTEKAIKDKKEVVDINDDPKKQWLSSSAMQRIDAIVKHTRRNNTRKNITLDEIAVMNKHEKETPAAIKDTKKIPGLKERFQRKNRVVRVERKSRADLKARDTKATKIAQPAVSDNSRVKARHITPGWKVMNVFGNGTIHLIGDKVNVKKAEDNSPELAALFNSLGQSIKNPKFSIEHLGVLIVRNERAIDVVMKSGHRIRISWDKADVELVDALMKKIIK